jgi:hypothetical protein
MRERGISTCRRWMGEEMSEEMSEKMRVGRYLGRRKEQGRVI